MKEFIISSRERTSGTSSNFTIVSDYPYKTFSKIKLIEASIPVSYNNASGQIIVTGGTSGATTIAITPSKYTMDSLKSFLQSALTAQKVGQSYTVTYTATGFFTIASTTETFTITFATQNAAAFGFAVGTTTSAASVTSSFSALSGLQVDSFINICSSQVGGLDNGTIILRQTQIQSFAIGSVIACGGGGIASYRALESAPWVSLPGGLLPSNFFLQFANGTAIDLNGAEWSMKIHLQR